MTEKYCPVPISVCEYGTGEKADCMNCDLNKRYSKKTIDNWETYIVDRETGKEYGYDVNTTINLLNELHEENNELRLQLNLCSDQRNEFHRGARENANRVGKLKKENEQLKKELFEARKDYILETYADNPIRRDEKMEALEKEFDLE